MSIFSFLHEDEDDEKQRILVLVEGDFESTVPIGLLSRKDIKPYEKDLLHAASIIAQKVDHHWEVHTAHNLQLREMERELNRLKKWKHHLSTRLTVLLILLVLFFQYGLPAIKESLSSEFRPSSKHQSP